LRDAAYALLLADVRPQDRPLAQELLAWEIDEHRQHDGVSDNMVVAAYLLAAQRRVEDCEILWHAKATNFSTWNAVSVALLVAGGVEATLAHWRRKQGLFARKPASTAIDVIEHARAAGQLADVDGRLAQFRDYCLRSFDRRPAASMG
jgi:hypothetical protein